jgi:hypothetical protein
MPQQDAKQTDASTRCNCKKTADEGNTFFTSKEKCNSPPALLSCLVNIELKIFKFQIIFGITYYVFLYKYNCFTDMEYNFNNIMIFKKQCKVILGAN